jgi:hypothetical protein
MRRELGRSVRDSWLCDRNGSRWDALIAEIQLPTTSISNQVVNEMAKFRYQWRCVQLRRVTMRMPYGASMLCSLDNHYVASPQAWAAFVPVTDRI